MRASPFQAVKTWKTSTDPNYEAKKNRVLELYALADGKKAPGPKLPADVIEKTQAKYFEAIARLTGEKLKA